MERFSELIPDFVDESLDYLENLENDIDGIKRETADTESIHRVFRAVLSIRGGSSFLGLSNLECLSHRLGDVLNLLRNNDLELTREIASSVSKAIDKLKEMLADEGTHIENINTAENIKELKACIKQKRATACAGDVALDVEDTSITIDKYTFDSLKRNGKRIYYIQFELRENTHSDFDNPLDFFREVEKTGEIVEQYVDMDLMYEDKFFAGEGIPLTMIYATALERELVANIFSVGLERVKELKNVSLSLTFS